jgi:SAM-dependent methyltransferase
MACGVGISTRALAEAFEDADAIVGVDTSPEMIGMARGIQRHAIEFGRTTAQVKQLLEKVSNPKFKVSSPIPSTVSFAAQEKYAIGNAERTIFPSETFNLVTIMYAFHEIPYLARYRILLEVRRVLECGGTLAIVDICPDEYKPSPSMLAGEPYVLEYQENIHDQISNITGFTNLRYKSVIPGHVGMWLLDKNFAKNKTTQILPSVPA